MALTLSCAGAATLQSAYIVFLMSRSDIPSGDSPAPFLSGGLQGSGCISPLDAAIDQWTTFTTGNQPNPTHGTWNATTAYNLGDTVASSLYAFKTSAGVVLAPLTYRSLHPANTNHPPENFDGWWTCIAQPMVPTNSNFVALPIAYALSPLPTAASLGATQWSMGLGNSLFWSPAFGPPGDIVQLMDIYVRLNYLVGSSIQPVDSRPQSGVLNAPNTGHGQILNPGINAQFQCWSTSGAGSYPNLLLSNWDTTAILNGAQPPGSFGTSYLTVLTAAGGTSPYTFGIVGGSLPPGVTLNPTTGVISGNPSGAGIFTFTAQVTDSTGATARATCAGPVGCGGGGGGKGNRFY